MPAPTAPNIGPDPKDAAPGQTPAVIEGPPEEEFWERYNKRLEFPLAAVATVFAHVVIGALLVFILVGLMAGDEDRSMPPLKLVDAGGFDDAGDGSAGSGGTPDPLAIQDTDPFKSTRDILPTPESLRDAKEDIRKIMLDDPNGNLPISAHNAAQYSQLSESLRKKLLGAGSQKGSGNQAGKGHDGTPGAGPGGTGADSTRARSLRWVLRFRVASGRDYLDQLKSMGAEILVPMPADDSKCVLFPDLGNTGVQRLATDADFKRLAGKIKFSDTRRDAVRGVAGALNLDFQPKTFWAFFPRELEDRLAREEVKFRNRRAEDIEETIFRVTIRGGSYEIVVDEQTIKR